MKHILQSAAFVIIVLAVANRTTIGAKILGNGAAPWF